MSQTSPSLKDVGFTWDPTWQGYERWTHLERGITCLRQPYMSDAQWEAEKNRCHALVAPSSSMPAGV
jgi:hypothetical protein